MKTPNGAGANGAGGPLWAQVRGPGELVCTSTPMASVEMWGLMWACMGG